MTRERILNSINLSREFKSQDYYLTLVYIFLVKYKGSPMIERVAAEIPISDKTGAIMKFCELMLSKIHNELEKIEIEKVYRIRVREEYSYELITEK